MRAHCLLFSILLWACGNRTAPSLDAPPTSDGRIKADLNRLDHKNPVADAPRPDRSGPINDAGSFCSGPTSKLTVGTTSLSVQNVAGMPTMTSCCEGEQLVVKAHGPAGEANTITFAMLRIPGADPNATAIDLAAPKGWSFFFKCDPYATCGYVNVSNADFSGTLKRTPLLGLPSMKVSVCASATVKPGAPPETKEVRLFVPDVTIHVECVPGMDQTCNHDPKISSYRGSCNADGTCTCLPGATKMANGKCL